MVLRDAREPVRSPPRPFLLKTSDYAHTKRPHRTSLELSSKPENRPFRIARILEALSISSNSRQFTARASSRPLKLFMTPTTTCFDRAIPDCQIRRDVCSSRPRPPSPKQNPTHRSYMYPRYTPVRLMLVRPCPPLLPAALRTRPGFPLGYGRYQCREC